MGLAMVEGWLSYDKKLTINSHYQLLEGTEFLLNARLCKGVVVLNAIE